MVSSVGRDRNHYQTLGLSPAASEDEIKQAFTTKMGLFGRIRWERRRNYVSPMRHFETRPSG